ncbi:uncharacterized protein [Pempheris klunzingeri]|uniref:uncharacterized protein n=1 Tax=Pempheris klunzingeri TaxID=3127111 RepID=UPI00397F99E3
MLALAWLWILTMKMVMRSDAASAEVIKARSGDAVLLTSDLLGGRPESRQDVRWTHLHLVMSLRTNRTTCHHGRCELLTDGSLRFSRVDAADAGNYSLNVFDEGGRLVMKKDFVLMVDAGITTTSSSLVSSLTICCFLLLLFFIIFFILRRRSQRMRTAGPPEENVYVVMHSHHGNKEEGKEKKQEREEDFPYVSCNAVVSMETPITQMSVDEDDVYV